MQSWKSAIFLLPSYFLPLFAPGRFIFDNVARNYFPQLNPRYAFAKKVFNIEFPFEKYLPKNKIFNEDNIASRIGFELFSWIFLFVLIFLTARLC